MSLENKFGFTQEDVGKKVDLLLSKTKICNGKAIKYSWIKNAEILEVSSDYIKVKYKCEVLPDDFVFYEKKVHKILKYNFKDL